MPRLNHANLPVADVAALRDFFARHFGFRVLATRGENTHAELAAAGVSVGAVTGRRPTSA